MKITLPGQLLVVGGARGIGASVVRLGAECGASVSWTYSGSQAGERGNAELLRCFPGSLSRAVDCADETEMNRFVSELGEVDYLVYNAGFTSPVDFDGVPVADWRRSLEINLTGAFIALKAVLPGMRKRKRGAVVLIGSAAVGTGGGGRIDYVSAKAGLEGLNKAITREFAPYGIRCNLLHPSLVETDLLHSRHPDPEKRAELAKAVPLRRLGQAEDIANLTVFLLSDLAGYITAQSVFVDGGRTFCK